MHDPAEPPEAEGIPDVADDASPRPAQDPEPQRAAVPGDVPVGVDEYGATASEARHGEPLSGKLNREEPDTPQAQATGERLVEPDEGARGDVDKDMVGRVAGSPEGDLSAEESAVHEDNPIDEQSGVGDDPPMDRHIAANEEPTA